jgi:pyrroloquinoline quinone biosynthesis protein D
VILPESRPALSAKCRLRDDRLSGKTILLAPERGLVLNPSAAAILRLCDAQRTVAEIVASLVGSTGGERATIAADVKTLLETLAERGLVTWQTP